MRIDKFLANMNVGSRKEVHQLIKQGLVTVNGENVKTPKQQVKESDQVLVGDQEVNYQQYHYFLLNKPQGVLSATEDLRQKTVLDLLAAQDRYQNLAPVGRLDKDTTGLLLITNDGQLNHELLSPKKHVTKIYRALIAGLVTQQTIENFAQGLELGDGTKLKPAKLTILATNQTQEQSQIEIEISEGKYHQIKRMFASQGMKVLELDRLAMGNLTLPKTLKRGQYQELTLSEIEKIR